jgi:hypothetical protein
MVTIKGTSNEKALASFDPYGVGILAKLDQESLW